MAGNGLKVKAAHSTATLVTCAVAVPEPFVTVQVCPSGCVRTVTEYVEPWAMAVVKVKGPSDAVARALPPLFCRVTVPTRPEIVPPMVTSDLQSTVTLVTLAVAVPVPFVTRQTWPIGCDRTVIE